MKRKPVQAKQTTPKVKGSKMIVRDLNSKKNPSGGSVKKLDKLGPGAAILRPGVDLVDNWIT